MGKLNKFLLLFASTIFLHSCLKQKDINLNIKENQYVVNALIQQDDSCRVYISKSQFLNDTSNIAYVDNAQVQLFENDNFIEELAYKLTSVNAPYYASRFKDFKEENKYSVKVLIPGYEKEIRSSDIIPKANASVSNFQGPQNVDSSTEFITYSLNLKKKNIEKSYYHIRFEERFVNWTLNGSDTLKFYSDWANALIFFENPFTYISNPSEPFALNLGSGFYGFMLDDNEIGSNGKKIEFQVKNFLINASNTYLESRLIINTVSENYFKYYYTSNQSYLTDNVSLSEVVIIHNNIINGIGNFSGFSADTSQMIRTNYK